MTLKSAPKRSQRGAPLPLGTKPSSSRALCRASTRFAKGARRIWTSPAPTAEGSGLLARLFGRRG